MLELLQNEKSKDHQAHVSNMEVGRGVVKIIESDARGKQFLLQKREHVDEMPLVKM